jgi:hypothetical protein
MAGKTVMHFGNTLTKGGCEGTNISKSLTAWIGLSADRGKLDQVKTDLHAVGSTAIVGVIAMVVHFVAPVEVPG